MVCVVLNVDYVQGGGNAEDDDIGHVSVGCVMYVSSYNVGGSWQQSRQY